MSSPSNATNATKWMSYLAEGLLAEEEVQPANPFFWCTGQQPVEQLDCSADNECSKGESDVPDKGCARKRYTWQWSVRKQPKVISTEQASSDDACCNDFVGKSAVKFWNRKLREEACSGAGNKACREKMRRDRLNDRFLELSAALEPGRPPKTDKATILCDAVRILTQLRSEAQQLQDSNNQLRDAIKDLKTEKNELRDEKTRLKADKERLEQQVKAMTIPTGYMPHPAAIHAAAAAFAAQSQAASNKAAQMAGYPGMAMWQWMPPAAVDTSHDHVLRPPVA